MERTRILVCAMAFGVLAATASCSSDEVTVSTPSETQSSSTAATTPAATAQAGATSGASSTAPAVNDANCLASELSVSLGQASGAAGSTELPVEFSNIGDKTCTLDGFPGVSYVSSPGGTQVGQAAVRAGTEMSPVELTPGASASAAVKATVVANYPADQCQPTSVSGLNVYSPNTTEAVYLPYPTTGCATSDTSITQLAVQPVTAG